MNKSLLLFVVDSIVGRVAHPGLRMKFILNELEPSEESDTVLIAKELYRTFKPKPFIDMHVMRNMTLWNKLLGRKTPDKQFESYALQTLGKLKTEGYTSKTVFLQSYSLPIAEKLKRMGFTLVQDLQSCTSRHLFELSERYGEVDGSKYRKLSAFQENYFSLIDHFLVPSPAVFSQIREMGIDETRVSVIPFGADISHFERKIFGGGKGCVFCFAGKVNFLKGMTFLLQAWEDKRFHNDTLCLFGGLTPEIRPLLETRKHKNILTPGFVKIEKFFPKCDIYVFPSACEGSSKSIYEAMGYSMPVITTFESGAPIENGKEGFMIPFGDTEALKEKMLYFKEHPEEIKRMGQAARETIQLFSWKNYADKVLDALFRLKKQ